MIHEAKTELIADFMGEALSSQEAINRVVNHNKSLAVRIWNWIKERLSWNASKAEHTFLAKAEKLYAKALQTAHGGISLDDIDKKYEEERAEDEITSTGKIKNETVDARYSIKTLPNMLYPLIVLIVIFLE